MMLTSRERVINAIERKPIDRPPFHFRAESDVFRKIKRERGLATDEDVRIWMGSDVRDLSAVFAEGGYGGYSGFGWQDRLLAHGVQEDFWKVQRRLVEFGEGAYIDICRSPLQGMSFAEIKAFAWPDPRTLFDFSSIPEKVRALNVGNEYWTLMEGESLFDRSWNMRGMEDFLADLVGEPEVADYILTRMADFFYERTAMILKAATGALDCVGLYDDFGAQQNMLINPTLYRDYIKPRQRRLIELVKNHDVKVFYHSCGCVESLYDDWIEIGVDIIDPVQLNALHTTPEALKAIYGDRVTFHGALDIQGFLQTASPEDVIGRVKYLSGTLGKGGGYILSGTHLFQVDIPVANYQAIRRALNDIV